MPSLRRRQRPVFSGFTNAEIEKMEKLLKEPDQPLCQKFFQKVARSFSYSAARAGKPAVKWTQVQRWFEKRPKKVASSNHDFALPKSRKMKKEENVPEKSELYEAKSSKDEAWYDVDAVISRKNLRSGKSVYVKFTGFGGDENEWVDENAMRQRSIPVEDSNCLKLNIGDKICCFQERGDEARHFDAHILDIKRKRHVSDCRCLFLVQYDHDKTEERVPLESLCHIAEVMR